MIFNDIKVFGNTIALVNSSCGACSVEEFRLFLNSENVPLQAPTPTFIELIHHDIDDDLAPHLYGGTIRQGGNKNHLFQGITILGIVDHSARISIVRNSRELLVVHGPLNPLKENSIHARFLLSNETKIGGGSVYEGDNSIITVHCTIDNQHHSNTTKLCLGVTHVALSVVRDHNPEKTLKVVQPQVGTNVRMNVASQTQPKIKNPNNLFRKASWYEPKSR